MSPPSVVTRSPLPLPRTPGPTTADEDRRFRRIALFAAYYPMTSRAGGGATGLSLLLSQSPRLGQLVVYGPSGAESPPAADPARLVLRTVWAPDDWPSLLGALRQMTRDAPELDGYLFSITVTTFGKSAPVNGLGLLLPILVRALTGKPVVVIMHNFVETQDAAAAGYAYPPILLRVARFVERLVVTQTKTVVGLESQKRIVESTVGGTVTYVPMLFMDAVNSYLSAPPPTRVGRSASGPVRVLLFGSWGPYKDMDGALTALRALVDRGEELEVTVAGAAHPHFPEYEARLEGWRRGLPGARFRFVGHVPEDGIRALFESHDVLLMPYLASGGFSGVMNFAALYGLPIIAYDEAQLRECARSLDASAQFIARGDVDGLASALGAVREARAAAAVQGSEAPETPRWLTRARQSAEDLLSLIASLGRPASPPPSGGLDVTPQGVGSPHPGRDGGLGFPEAEALAARVQSESARR